MNFENKIIILKTKIIKIEFREFFSFFLALKQICQLFESAGFTLNPEEEIENPTRRGLVETFYDSVDWNELKNIQKLLKVIEYSFQLHFLNSEAKQYLNRLCGENDITIEDNKLILKELHSQSDRFSKQFPAGLPFGIPKPQFAIKAKQGGQQLKYEITNGLGLLEGKVYPNFRFKDLEELYDIDSSSNKSLRIALANMNQTEYEREFLIQYAKKFDMVNQDIPVLIPQAWIQWHSQSKRNLRETSSLQKDDIYRVDFVAFCNNKRYIILVDDISHYGIQDKTQNIWYASEEGYAKRLKEDRKLRTENWHVFRVSNWEIRNKQNHSNILEDLRDFIGF